MEKLIRTETATEPDDAAGTRKNLSSELENFMRDALGFKCGTYHSLLLIFLLYETIVAPFSTIFISIANLKPSATCFHGSNLSAYNVDYCATLQPNATVCPVGWNLHIDDSFQSLAQEWPHTVCNVNATDRLTHKIASITNAGKLISTVLAGVIADSLGRKSSFVIGTALRLIGAIWLPFVESWQAFSAALFVAIFGTSMIFYPHRTLVMEFFTRRYRLLPACFTMWILNYIIFALIAYLTGSWRSVAVVGAALSVPAFIGAIASFESPRWLIENRKFGKAAVSFNCALIFNRSSTRVTKKELTERFGGLTPSPIGWRRGALRILIRFVLLFKRPELRWITVTVALLRLHSAVRLQIFSLSLDQFGLNPFLVTALQGLMRIWLPFLLIYVDMRAKSFRRRLFFLVLIALSIVVGILSIITMSLNLRLVSTISMLCEDILATMVWVAWWQIIAEYYPTNTRNTAFGFLYFAYVIGQSVAPQLVQLRSYWTPLPFCIPILFLLSAAVIGFFAMPETRAIPQIANFADLEAFPRARPKVMLSCRKDRSVET